MISMPQPRPIPEQTREQLFEFARQRASGKTRAEAALALGISGPAISQKCQQWPAVWREAMQAAGIFPGFRPEPRLTYEQAKARLFEYARQRAAGLDVTSAAEPTGVSYTTIAHYAKQWPDTWKQAMQAAGMPADIAPRSVLPNAVRQARADGDTNTLPGFFETIYRPRRLLGRSKTTVRLYDVTLTHFARFLGRMPLLADLTDGTIASFLDWMDKTPAGSVDRRKRSPRTVNKFRDQLMAIARFAFYKKLLDEMPDVVAMPEPRKLPIAFTVEEIGRLLAACLGENKFHQGHGWSGYIAGIPVGAYWFAVVSLIYWTGLRAGAVWGMPRQNVNLDAGTVLAEASTQKQRSDQLLRIHPDCVEALRAIWVPEREMMFPWPYNVSSRYNQFRAILSRAGLTCERHSVFHKIRKTTATLCKRFGADATAQLGHSSDAVTRRHYLAPDATIQAADVLPRPTMN